MMLSSLVKPYLIWIKIGALIALVVSSYFFGSSVKENELTLKYAQAYQNQYEQYRKKEKENKQYVAKLDQEYTKELFDAQDTIDNIIDDVSSGKRGLYVSTEKNERKVQSTRTSTSMDNAERRAKLDENTAREIIRLTARGDKAIIQLTACQKYISGLIKP